MTEASLDFTHNNLRDIYNNLSRSIDEASDSLPGFATEGSATSNIF